ncbi:type II secretion system minor pseudopilin GspH [Alkalimarinus sediminis]|uniref:Type II secretion system protein H n=1 Tax=Alkalimarinus sediminis TaxID=1632866 RepID=A0A9E8HKX6_9ALTE|nr:type II secretion system minor pseudopilin GspH [Alkalimarinus sediminis]UZW76225.1 type II secretion system minor pseudopilin GspH [Alkalimarinus sediminis]
MMIIAPTVITKRHQGFTLIEILVVMVLLGLLTGVAVFTLGSGKQQRELANESQRLHALLRMASEEAILSNTEIGFSITEDGYEFLQYDDKELTWSNSSVAVLKSREFPEWVAVEFQRDGENLTILGREEEELKKPDMMLLSSGEVTPFTIRLQVEKNSESQFVISSDGLEEIKLVEPGKEDEE